MRVETSSHVLIRKHITFPKTWPEWKIGFEEETDGDALLGRLHSAFKVKLEGNNEERELQAAERLCLFLELADGHAGWIMTGHDWRGIDGRVLPEIREVIAKKAAQLLAKNFLEPNESHNWIVMPQWAPTVLREEVFQKVLWFFRAGPPHYHPEGSTCTIPNLHPWGGKKEHEEVLAKFARQFCYVIWKQYLRPGNPPYHMNPQVTMMLTETQPKVLGLMDYLGNLEYLLKPEVVVSDASMRHLQELALKRTWNGGANEKPFGSIVEALKGGSRAAQVFTLLQIQQGKSSSK